MKTSVDVWEVCPGARRRWPARILLLGILAIGSLHVDAAPILVGLITFDPLVAPASPDYGVNEFKIYNLTGDPSAGGFASSPDFPVLTALQFTNISFSFVASTVVQSVSLGDVSPGISGSVDLQFSGAIAFAAAALTSAVDKNLVTLSDGTTWMLSSTALEATLLPSSGTDLVPGQDLALLWLNADLVDGGPDTSVPEPSALLLVTAGIAVLSVLQRRK